METKIRNLILLVALIAASGQIAPARARIAQVEPRFSLNGELQNNAGKLRLILTNNSAREFRGAIQISLGNSDEQKDVGQVLVTLPPKEISLLQINGLAPSGDHYSLAIYDQQGGRLFFRIASLRQVSDPTPATAIAITPAQTQRSKTGSSATLSSTPSATDEFARTATQVQVKARLLASADASDSFTLFFELSSSQPVNSATLAITAATLKDQKQVSIYSQSNAEFRLPDSLETDKVNYTLTDKSGRVLAKGELNLQKLMDDDYITISDIRTDRPSYQPGDTARMTIMVEGKTQSGYRIEVSARDGQSQTIFRDQRTVGRDDQVSSLDFSFTISSSISIPVVFEFRIFDAETGLLFDSGEREVPMAAKPPNQ
ncbi:MAG: hypothetical protein ACKVZH_04875 [Blastocatellia bacterium]